MSLDISGIVERSLRQVAEKHGFIRQHEVNDGQEYSVEYFCSTFVVRLDRYRVEFYALLYKPGYFDEAINLFNLLAFMAGARQDAPTSEYFHDEESIKERYRKQVEHIAATLDHHFKEIADFFRGDDIESKFVAVTNFMIRRYPNLFKKK